MARFSIAIEADRRLMAERAEWVAADIEITVTLRSAQECLPDERT